MTLTRPRDWLTQRWQRHETMLRYLMVGGINTLFGVTLYPALTYFVPYFHRHYLIALGLSQASCLCFAFLMYKLMVFRAHGNLFKEISTFASFYVVAYSINWIMLPLLVEFVHLRPSTAQIGFTTLSITISYIWHNKVTFASRRGQ